MKTSIALIASLLCLVLVFAVGCGTAEVKENPTTGTKAPSPETTGTEAVVLPADAVGCVVSANEETITWNAFEMEEDTIDFLDLNVKLLIEPAKDMSILYMEDNISYYFIRNGKLYDAELYDVIPGSIIGVTTIEEGMQEVYILSVPVDPDEFEEIEEMEEEQPAVDDGVIYDTEEPEITDQIE